MHPIVENTVPTSPVPKVHNHRSLSKVIKEPSEHQVRRSQNTNIILMSLGFCFVICGLKIIGSFGTPLLGSLGAVSVAFIYLGGAVSFIIGPSIIDRLPSASFGMKILGPEYGVYILMFVYFIPWLNLTWSLIHGIVASMIWSCETIFLKENSTPETAGRKSGTFWGIYMTGSIVGNLFVYYIFSILGYEYQPNATGWLGSVSYMFASFALLSFIGCSFFFCFKSIPDQYKPPTAPKTSVKKRFQSIFKSFIKPRVAIVLPIAIAWGYSLPFVNAMFNRQIDDTKSIGLITAFLSLIEVIFSFIFGPIMDKLGLQTAMLLTTISEFIGLIISYPASIYQNWLFYLSIAFLAIGDTGYQTLLPVIITQYRDEPVANACIRFTANIAGGIAFLIAPLFIENNAAKCTEEKFLLEIIICAIIIAFGQIFFWIYKYIYPLSETQEILLRKKDLSKITIKQENSIKSEDGNNDMLSVPEIKGTIEPVEAKITVSNDSGSEELKMDRSA